MNDNAKVGDRVILLDPIYRGSFGFIMELPNCSSPFRPEQPWYIAKLSRDIRGCQPIHLWDDQFLLIKNLTKIKIKALQLLLLQHKK